ncbi:MAG: cache domain-containing protein [Alphaproteobacteria bacterium]|nr:cache domain-containing protein [Alphaproteobacteria bacterium]
METEIIYFCLSLQKKVHKTRFRPSFSVVYEWENLMRFQNLKLSVKIGALVIMSFVFLFAASAYFINKNRTTLLDDRKEKTENLIEVAHSLVMRSVEREKSGELTREQAQQEALDAVKVLRYDNGGNYFWINDMRPVMLMHPLKPKMIGTDISKYKDGSPSHFARMIEVVSKEGSGFVDYFWTSPDGKSQRAKLSFVKGVPEWGWVIGSGIYIDDVNAIFLENVIKSGSFIAVAFLLMGGIALVVIRGIVKPLSKITENVKELAEDKVISVDGLGRKDEVGDMARGLEYLNERLKNARLLEKEQELQKVQAEKDRRQSMLDMADRFENQVGDAIAAVLGASAQLEGTSESMTSLAEQTSSKAARVSTAAQLASENVQSVASATEELTASISEISQQMQQTDQSTKQAAVSVSETEDTMGRLTATVEKVGSVATVIAGIAEQTNLLALNATIEAARAGEAGKGFAVVANEVKTLATQTANATKEITDIIKEVQMQTAETATSVKRIATVIDTVAQATTSVSAAVEEQNAATGEISRSVQNASEGTHDVTTNINEVSSAAFDSGTAASELLKVSSEMSQKTRFMEQEVKSFLASIRA